MWLLIDHQVGSREGFPNESAGGIEGRFATYSRSLDW